MFSYPLSIDLMKQNTPEFEELAAFQAGRSAVAACAAVKATAMAKPLRGEFVTGNYFSTFGISAFAGRTIQAA